jgi:hypothetical protein
MANPTATSRAQANQHLPPLRATYRVQLNARFTLPDLRANVP